LHMGRDGSYAQLSPPDIELKEDGFKRGIDQIVIDLLPILIIWLQ
jgi:hypothetical protein